MNDNDPDLIMKPKKYFGSWCPVRSMEFFPMSEWYMARFAVENGHQEDNRLDYVIKRYQSNIRASNSNLVIVNTIGNACYVITC